MEITHNEQQHMFKIEDGGINIIHTFVPKPLQSKGHGSALVITCPSVHTYVARHKEYESLL